MRSYQDMLARRKNEFGDHFDASALASQFIKYYESQERIKVLFSDGSTECGTIGVSTGRIPCFLLIRRVTDMGSSNVLAVTDKVIAVQRGKKYYPI